MKNRSVTPINADEQEVRFARVLNWFRERYGDECRTWPRVADRVYGAVCDLWAEALYHQQANERRRISSGPLERGGRILVP